MLTLIPAFRCSFSISVFDDMLTGILASSESATVLAMKNSDATAGATPSMKVPLPNPVSIYDGSLLNGS